MRAAPRSARYLALCMMATNGLSPRSSSWAENSAALVKFRNHLPQGDTTIAVGHSADPLAKFAAVPNYYQA